MNNKTIAAIVISATLTVGGYKYVCGCLESYNNSSGPSFICNITAASANLSDVQTAVSASHDGQNVCIPAGNVTWTSTLTIGDPFNLGTNPLKAITLHGAGMGSTVITDGITGTNTTRILRWNTEANSTLTRLTGITFQGGVNADPYNDPLVYFSGQNSSTRVDHCMFIPTQNVIPGLRWDGGMIGVIDHNTFNISAGQGFGMYLFHNAWTDSSCPGNPCDYGDYSWHAANTLGTVNAIYVENNTFTNNQSVTQQYYANDGWMGGRVVYRYNTYVNTTWANHGTESSGRWRSQRQFEVYNNTFSLADTNSFEDFLDVRGGTGVIYNNIATNTGGSGTISAFAALKNFRSNQAFSPWGQCTGSNGWDQNANITNGYRCMDQVGAGVGDLLASNFTPTPVAWLNEVLDPVYVWNNTLNGAISAAVISDNSVITLNQDYYSGIARPGYSAYTYPHPLVTSP